MTGTERLAGESSDDLNIHPSLVPVVCTVFEPHTGAIRPAPVSGGGGERAPVSNRLDERRWLICAPADGTVTIRFPLVGRCANRTPGPRGEQPPGCAFEKPPGAVAPPPARLKASTAGLDTLFSQRGCTRNDTARHEGSVAPRSGVALGGSGMALGLIPGGGPDWSPGFSWWGQARRARRGGTPNRSYGTRSPRGKEAQPRNHPWAC